jgi:hypothetical protein
MLTIAFGISLACTIAALILRILTRRLYRNAAREMWKRIHTPNGEQK